MVVSMELARETRTRGGRADLGCGERHRLHVALITEGTYPFVKGGVSVWCDQILNGLPSHDFTVYALTATGAERPVWTLPANVPRLVSVPTWGGGPSPRRPSRELESRFAPTHERMLAALAVDTGPEDFTAALYELWRFGQRGELASALLGDCSVQRVLQAMRDARSHGRPGAKGERLPNVADAVTALRLVEHVLRPLSVEPPDADLCHAVANGPSALLAMSAKWAHATPFLMTEHGVYLRERYLEHRVGTLSDPVRAHLLRFYRHLTEAGYGAADVISPCCEYNRLWERINGADDARIHPIFNGVDAAGFPRAVGEPDVPTVAFVGRIDPLKDIETLLRAFSHVRDVIPAARLRMFGPVPVGNERYYRRCLDLRRELGIDEAAIFEGPVSPVVQAYHAGTIVALTSISEGFPYVLLEAMAAGRATVATDVGGVGEVTGNAGLIVAPRDPQAAGAAMVRLLGNARLRHRLAAKGHRRVLTQFTLDRCLDGYTALYDACLTARPSEPTRVVDLATATDDGVLEDACAGRAS